MSYHKRSMRGIVNTAKHYRVSSEVTSEAISDVLSALDCPRALTVYLLYRQGEHEQLAQLEANPLDYDSLEDFRDAYAATKLLSKAVFLDLPYDKKARALEKFEKFEQLCKQTNHRFRNLTFDPDFSGPNVWLLNATIRKIEKVLGRWDTDKMLDLANWGPGVTTLIKGDGVSAVNKFQCETGTTRDLYALLPLDGFPFIYPGWQGHLKKIGYPTFQVGNRVITVPKDAKADRVIAVEPGLNLWFQKGIGSIIRRKLFRAGIDLNTQERNQQLARSGSETHTLATVDFSSASDSISRLLVRELLPPDWYRAMDAVRSHYGIRSGVSTLWEKFSSMGNGFTFELESLIFFAAATAVAEYVGDFSHISDISVYGDDVIIPVSCFELFSSFCAFLGFEVNRSKSFSTGSFRESCGRHFWEGMDVTPIYLKQIASSVLAVYRLANAVRAWAHRRAFRFGCDSSLRSCWTRLFHSVPDEVKLVGCYGYGDGAFIGNFDESHCVVAKDSKVREYHGSGIEGYLSVAISSVGITRYAEGDGLLFARLRSSSLQEYGNYYTLRGRTRIKAHLILVQQWYDLGPWFIC